jgi:hypothetical protein
VTERFAVIVTVHVGAEPLHAPDQLRKREPADAVAVRVTVVPFE